MFNRMYLLTLCALNISPDQRCRLNSRSDFGEPLPIILRNGQLLEPTDKFGNVELHNGDNLTLSCEGTGPILHPNAERQVTTETITCEAGHNFKNEAWLGGPSSFHQFRCQVPPYYQSRKLNRTCFEHHSVFEVGYYVRDNFYPLYESCFDETGLKPIYSKYSQKPYNAMFQQRVDRPYFIADDIHRLVPVQTVFSPAGLRTAVMRVVGPLINTYVTPSEGLSRGHLAAKTDFVFAFGERATFHYINCAPQWKGFNGGNWNTLEIDVRNHVHETGDDTIIYTGTFEVSTLINQYGRREQLHLDVDEHGNPVIPVPQYFYKVVYNPSKLTGTAFVGINNPYYSLSEAKELFFCRDMCRGRVEFSWLTWHPDNPAEGYTFCCAVDDFRRVVQHLPPFNVTELWI